MTQKYNILMIRKATNLDIDAILEITKSCLAFMVEQHIFQWNEHYPNKNAFLNDLERDELFVIEENSELIGCITISTFMDDVYKPVLWLTPNNKNIYIHRLAIHPKHQGMGHAQQLMTFAETYAADNGFKSVRLDTFSKNPRNMKFYERRGYKPLEPIYFPNQSEHPFYCYELPL